MNTVNLSNGYRLQVTVKEVTFTAYGNSKQECINSLFEKNPQLQKVFQIGNSFQWFVSI